MKIKICKIESKAFAKYCIKRGADYLGVHVIDFTLDDTTADLCRYISHAGGKAVLLTKEKDTKKLAELVAFYRPWALQLHYQTTAVQCAKITEELGVPVVPVFTEETDIHEVRAILAGSEFAIYDTSFRGGTGDRHGGLHLKDLKANELGKVLIAGGVDPDYIASSRESGVGGYDIQSYCREGGRHHYGKTKTLFDVAKSPETRSLSVSLTDLLDIQTIPKYEDSECLEYQVDYSTGNLYEHFVVDNDRVLKTIAEIDAPVTLHIFEKDIRIFQEVVDVFKRAAGNNIVRVNIQYSDGLDVDAIDVYSATRCASLYYKDIGSYLKQYGQPHECISLILPSELDRKAETLASYSSEIERFIEKEVWFDRRVDQDTVRLVLSVDPRANFIVGEYILDDWKNEAVLIKELARA